MNSIFDVFAVDKISARSVYMEVPVNPEASPFLVSSPGGYIWVEEASKGIVRVGIQKDEGVLDMMVLKAITQRSLHSGWGNVLPLSDEGLERAVEYLVTYGYARNELCILSDTQVDSDIPTAITSWLPQGVSVVMPADKSYFGWKSDLGSGRRAALVHNASRGVVILLNDSQRVNFHVTSSTPMVTGDTPSTDARPEAPGLSHVSGG
jgi:hypothetical protein